MVRKKDLTCFKKGYSLLKKQKEPLYGSKKGTYKEEYKEPIKEPLYDWI